MKNHFLLLILLLLLTIPVDSNNDITVQWIEVESDNPIKMNHLSMVFDYKNDVLIQFSGRNYNGSLSDLTIVYDFKTNEWINMKPEVSPPARQYARMSYNPNEGTVLLFGGANTGGMSLDDFWQYDYLTNIWTEIIVSPRPSARYFQAMGFSPLENSLIIFDGQAMFTSLGEEFFWEFNLDSMEWTQHPVFIDKSISEFQGIDSQSSMVYDSKRDVMLLFTYYNVLQYNLDNHSLINIANLGNSRSICDITYDSYHDKFILFGGYIIEENQLIPTDSTGIFDYETLDYSIIDDAGEIGPRHTENNMAYDPNRNRTILLSGSDETSYYNDMWILTLDDPSMETSSISSISDDSQSTQETFFKLEAWFLVPILIVKYFRKSYT